MADKWTAERDRRHPPHWRVVCEDMLIAGALSEPEALAIASARENAERVKMYRVILDHLLLHGAKWSETPNGQLAKMELRDTISNARIQLDNEDV